MVGRQSFPFGFRPIFSCELLVSGSVPNFSTQRMQSSIPFSPLQLTQLTSGHEFLPHRFGSFFRSLKQRGETPVFPGWNYTNLCPLILRILGFFKSSSFSRENTWKSLATIIRSPQWNNQYRSPPMKRKQKHLPTATLKGDMSVAWRVFESIGSNGEFCCCRWWWYQDKSWWKGAFLMNMMTGANKHVCKGTRLSYMSWTANARWCGCKIEAMLPAFAGKNVHKSSIVMHFLKIFNWCWMTWQPTKSFQARFSLQGSHQAASPKRTFERIFWIASIVPFHT